MLILEAFTPTTTHEINHRKTVFKMYFSKYFRLEIQFQGSFFLVKEGPKNQNIRPHHDPSGQY